MASPRRQHDALSRLFSSLVGFVENYYPGTAPSQIQIQLNDGSRCLLKVPEKSTLPDHHFRHSSDYRSASWGGHQFTFTPTQAACLRVLHDAYNSGTAEMSQQTILEIAGSESQNLREVFKLNEAWGKLIVQGSTIGTYRLADPE